MAPRISATDAKNNFGGLLELVLAHGRVEITKHGRVIAVVLSPALAEAEPRGRSAGSETHMIPPVRARAARMIRPPRGFEDP